MLHRPGILLGLLAACGLPAALLAAGAKPAVASLSAAQIVERNVAARGGLLAWESVKTMSWTGKMDAGTGDSSQRSAAFVRDSWKKNRAARAAKAATSPEPKVQADPQIELPFVLEMKRPGKSRVEIEFDGKKAIQVYDGTNGWKIRPFLNRNDAEPFTAEEAKSQAGNWQLDGPLVDYAAKGTRVELAGLEPVDGHNAYKLTLTTKAGLVQHIWIDAQTFLDVKVEGTPRHMDGRMRAVWVYQRDFRSVNGLKIPFVLETAVDGYPDTHKMTLDKVAVNPTLDDALFTKPKA